ncbi:MAG: hypothetical protein HN377_08545, partial [Alphaproteobacteria bacterium]|nr:hypothetical protein [Alphaproteobacteria bacterium]
MMAEPDNAAWEDAFPLEVTKALDVHAERVVGGAIANVPAGARLSAGTDDGGGRWSLSEGDLEGLTISPPVAGAGRTTLTVSLLVRPDGDTAQPPETVAFGLT